MNTLAIYQHQAFELHCRFTLTHAHDILNQLEWKWSHDPSADLQKIWLLQIRAERKLRSSDQNHRSWVLHAAITLHSGNEIPRMLSFSLSPKPVLDSDALELTLFVIHIHSSGLTVWHG